MAARKLQASSNGAASALHQSCEGCFRDERRHGVEDGHAVLARGVSSALLGCNTECAVDGDASPTAHGDAVQECHLWLWHRGHQMVQGILLLEEPALSGMPCHSAGLMDCLSCCSP